MPFVTLDFITTWFTFGYFIEHFFSIVGSIRDNKKSR